MPKQFPISHERWSEPLLRLFGRSSVDLGDGEVVVCFGVMFKATIVRTSIRSARTETRRTLSKGAHGWCGRWLVNGSSRGLVTITIEPPGRARVVGVPVQLRELTVSVDDPNGFIAALNPTGQPPADLAGETVMRDTPDKEGAAMTTLEARKRPAMVLAGGVVTLLGLLFTFQGLGAVKGSSMTNSNFWAATGPVIAVFGLVLAVRGAHGGRGPHRCWP